MNTVLNRHVLKIFDKKTGKKKCGMEMDALEKMGLVKLDILGVAILDKLMTVNHLLEHGTIG